MTPLRLTSWFSRRMLPLVLALSAIVAAATPIAFYVQKRHELGQTTRAEAQRVAELVRIEIEERPRMWRYDAIKLGERLAAEGLDRHLIRIFSSEMEVGVERLHAAPPPRVPLWGRHDLVIERPGGNVYAQVWVAVDAAPLYAGTALLAAVFALLAIGLGTVLYLLPVRAIAGAERRTHLLLGQLALTLQEADRRRIARDLHDGAGQAITAARLELIGLVGQSNATAEDGAAVVKRITDHLDEALAEVRRSTAALAPPALAELGLAAAVARHCEAIADAAHLALHCEVASSLPSLPAEMELACYRIVQEALTNIVRHAAASSAWVRIRVAGFGAQHDAPRPTVIIEVEDNGAGLSADAGGGRGLEGIRERARLLGGECLLSSGEGGGGLRLRVSLPLPDHHAPRA